MITPERQAREAAALERFVERATAVGIDPVVARAQGVTLRDLSHQLQHARPTLISASAAIFLEGKHHANRPAL